MTLSIRIALACLLGVAVPLVTLHLTTEDERQLRGLTAAPFAWPRLLLAHLVLALPWALVVAGAIRQRIPASLPVKISLVVLAGLIPLVIALLGHGFVMMIRENQLGVLAAVGLRSALAMVCVLPWCLLLMQQPVLPWNSGNFFVVTAIAILPAGMYTQTIIKNRLREVEQHLTGERLVLAHAVIQGLAELGCKDQIGQQPIRELDQYLHGRISRLRQEANSRWTATPDNQIQRALLLIQLHELDDAVMLLRPLADDLPIAALLLAKIYRELEQYQLSSKSYQALLDRYLPQCPEDPTARELCRHAYQGLAENARVTGQPEVVEPLLHSAREHLPQYRASWLFMLGQHALDGGRPGLASQYFQEALALDPNLEPDIRVYRNQLSMSTPRCFQESWLSPFLASLPNPASDSK